MSNPFPGMDPYLEQHWRDVHHRLITYASDEIQAQLPPDLCARVEERVVVEPADDVERNVYPDVRVVEHGSAAVVAVRSQAAANGAGRACADQPGLFMVPHHERSASKAQRSNYLACAAG